MINHVVFFQAQNNSTEDSIISNGVLIGESAKFGSDRTSAVSKIADVKSGGKEFYRETDFSAFERNGKYLFEITSDERDFINRRMAISFLVDEAEVDDYIKILKQSIILSGRIYNNRYSDQIKNAIKNKKKVLMIKILILMALGVLLVVGVGFNHHRNLEEPTEKNKTYSY